MAEISIQQFNLNAFLKAAFMSYVFPLVSTILPGYFLDKPDLIQASYSTISVSSLIATVICFGLLRIFIKRQILIFNKFEIAVFFSALMVLLAICVINVFQIHDATWNIVPSAIIGAVMLAMTKL